ncbi:Uncharacterised protein [Sphingobacterium spiritivorum]|uniref:Uncharacterized protein n=1 Tax=Sphingobacterium spiritivorum TaxID=258 RepID=A0A380C367_SPHSI|nr:Uncharacterised protein [Sphingobacterium spiritivorum]
MKSTKNNLKSKQSEDLSDFSDVVISFSISYNLINLME